MSTVEQTILPGYKRTEVGVIPEDWEVQRLSQIARIVGGGTPSTTVAEYWNGTIPWVSAADVSRVSTNGRYILNTEERITKLGLAACPAQILPSGTTIIIARGATVGRMAQFGKDMAFNQTCYGLLAGYGIDRDYLYYAMLYSVDSIRALTYGTIFGTITTNTFREWYIPVPPTEAEQRAIAEALSDVDALIAALDARIAKQRAVKTAAMQRLLTGEQRLPGFSGQWETKRLGGILSVRHGKSQGGIVNSAGRYPILASGGEIGRTNTFLYDKPSVLIGRKGTIDSPQYQESPFWTIDTLFYTEIKGSAHPKFVFYKFLMIDWRSHNEASGVPSLNASTIENIEITLPPLDEQRAIAAVLADMDAALAALEAQRAKTTHLKQAMMQELLTGRTRLV